MKTTLAIRLLVVLLGFAAAAAPRGYAQSEIDPDHFDSPNTEGFPQPKTKPDVGAETGKGRFRGQFTLPYSVRCAGKRLPRGNYSFSLRSDGKIGRATLNQKGQSMQVTGVVRAPADSREQNVLFVECRGNTRRLSAIHVAELDVVLDPPGEQMESSSPGEPSRIEKLPLFLAGPQK